MWGLHSRTLAYINDWIIYKYITTDLIQESLRCDLNPKHNWNPHVHQQHSVVDTIFKRDSIWDVLSVGSPQQNASIYCQCRNYRREVEEYEGTVIYRTLLLDNSVFLGRCEKNVSEFTPNFLRRSIILVGALLFYNYVFPHFSHISHFRSIINVSRAPFYNSCRSAAVL